MTTRTEGALRRLTCIGYVHLLLFTGQEDKFMIFFATFAQYSVYGILVNRLIFD